MIAARTACILQNIHPPTPELTHVRTVKPFDECSIEYGLQHLVGDAEAPPTEPLHFRHERDSVQRIPFIKSAKNIRQGQYDYRIPWTQWAIGPRGLAFNTSHLTTPTCAVATTSGWP